MISTKVFRSTRSEEINDAYPDHKPRRSIPSRTRPMRTLPWGSHTAVRPHTRSARHSRRPIDRVDNLELGWNLSWEWIAPALAGALDSVNFYRPSMSLGNLIKKKNFRAWPAAITQFNQYFIFFSHSCALGGGRSIFYRNA